MLSFIIIGLVVREQPPTNARRLRRGHPSLFCCSCWRSLAYISASKNRGHDTVVNCWLRPNHGGRIDHDQRKRSYCRRHGHLSSVSFGRRKIMQSWKLPRWSCIFRSGVTSRDRWFSYTFRYLQVGIIKTTHKIVFPKRIVKITYAYVKNKTKGEISIFATHTQTYYIMLTKQAPNRNQ